MSYKIVKEFTADMADKDYLVFLKTNFQSPVLNAKGNIVKWTQDADNYVYGLFPNRKRRGMMSESYVKPQGEILSWKDKLRPTDAMELDALSEDLPATWEEFSDLLTKLRIDGEVEDGVIVIEDAATWQKLGAARKRLLRKQMEDCIEGTVGRELPPDAPICDPYPLAMAM